MRDVPDASAASEDIRLEAVTATNWRDCATLTVRPEQQRFVNAVTYYLCLCHYGSTWQPLAISRAGDTVGFVMWGVDDDGSRWIGGLVVDAGQQRTGVGRGAIQRLLERFAGEPDCPNVALSYQPDNTAARDLYACLGFVETGETEDDEVVARRPN